MEDLSYALDQLSNIEVYSNANNDLVTIYGHPSHFRCVGVGTDAAVFQYADIPHYAFKLYANDKLSKIKTEAEVYERLEESPFFPKCYNQHDRCLILSYEEGITLFDCLLQGIHIPNKVVEDVEAARAYARQKGLNPRDLHLKNIIMQQGRAKIIDVSEYMKPGNDYRWEHLLKAYEYYHLIDGKSVPFWMLETIRKWYNKWQWYYPTFDEFMKSVLKFTTFWK